MGTDVSFGTAALVFVIGTFVNTMGLFYTQHHGLKHFVDKGCTNPRDVGFLSFTHDPTTKEILDGPLFILLPTAFMAASTRRVELFRDLLLMFGIVLVIRGISISLTQLPHTTEPNRSRSLIDSCLFGGDYDKIFSGHTAFIVISTMLLVKYGVWPTAMYVLPVVVALLLVQTRSHYTVDVFLGAVISFLTVTAATK